MQNINQYNKILRYYIAKGMKLAFKRHSINRAITKEEIDDILNDIDLITNDNQTIDYVKEDSKKDKPWWHLEGYLYDTMVFVSKVPERIRDASYVKSTISLVGSLRQQVSENLIAILDRISQITPDKDNYTLYRIDFLK